MKEIKKLTLTLTITFLLILLFIPVSNAATGTITVDTLRVRKTPSTSSDVLRNLDKGDKIEVIEQQDDWYKIKLSDGKEAYVYAEYVKLDEELSTNEVQNTEENGESEELKLEKNTRIYILPALFSSEISRVTEDTTVKVVEKINNWVCVEYNGTTGWVLQKGTVVDNEPQQPEENKTEEPETKTGYVNVSSAYVRKEANTSAEILTSLILNNEVTILKEVDGWYEIKLSDGTGYIYAQLVSDKKTEVSSRNLRIARTTATTRTEAAEQKDTEQKAAEQKVIKKVYVSASALNVRETASTSAKIVTTLKQKTEVSVLEDLSNWYKITTSKGEGYVLKQYTVDSLDKIVVKKETTTTARKETSVTGAASGTAQEVVTVAKKYVGCKYVYGGSGPTSFDCSGLTMYVYKQFGVSLPHNARTQANYGKYVSKANLQPGDLLIFNDYANTSIGHAGIYIGDGKFVHAANSKTGVTIGSIDSSYYSKRFVEGRRLV